MDLGPRERSRGEAGITLLEILIVVALLGLITVILTVAVANAIKKGRVETTGRQLQSFLENTYIRSLQSGRTVFVTITPVGGTNPARTVTLYDDVNQNNIFSTSDDTPLPGASMILTEDVQVQMAPLSGEIGMPAVGSYWVIGCDPKGNTINPVTGRKVTTLVSLDLFQKDNDPNINIHLTATPLWHVSMAQHVAQN